MLGQSQTGRKETQKGRRPALARKFDKHFGEHWEQEVKTMKYREDLPLIAGRALDRPELLFELGLIRATGRNCEANLVEAHKWFNIAAFGGFEAAKASREDISAEMTREQIAEAQRAARAWLTENRGAASRN
jgi:uncharacterized protein